MHYIASGWHMYKTSSVYVVEGLYKYHISLFNCCSGITMLLHWLCSDIELEKVGKWLKTIHQLGEYWKPINCSFLSLMVHLNANDSPQSYDIKEGRG